MCRFRVLLPLLALSSLLPVPIAAAPAARRAAAGDPALLARLGATPVGGRFDLAEAPGLGTLELERFEVFAPDAALVAFTAEGAQRIARPEVAYFRGRVAGDPSSTAVLSVHRDGLRGLVQSRGRLMVVGRGARAAAPDAQLLAVEVDPTSFASRAAEFSCGAEDHELEPPAEIFAAPAGEPAATLEPRAAGLPAHTARIALETDYEYFQKFGNRDAALAYAGDLVAFASTIYARDIDTSLVIGAANIRTTAGDPWAETSSMCGLYEFGRYWNQNYTGIDRTIAHFLSGKSSNSGIAWLGVLCSGGFNYSVSGCSTLPSSGAYGGAYGYTSGIDGNFDLDHPAIVWDLLGFMHEVGHNFNSPHTHCYNKLSAGAQPVDQCYNGEAANGCYGGTSTLPGPTGAGSGTIMSYCHLRSGGMSNITLTFGSNADDTVIHPYGVQPQRVSQRMRSHVASRAAGNPACLAPVVPSLVFSDGFEAGNASHWAPN